jgi:hypothetical protein
MTGQSEYLRARDIARLKPSGAGYPRKYSPRERSSARAWWPEASLAALRVAAPDTKKKRQDIVVDMPDEVARRIRAGAVIAENGFVRRCVEAERFAAIECHRDSTVTALATGDLGFARAKATLARAKLACEMLVQTKAMDAPEKIGLIPGVLQHASPEVSEQHYNLVRSVQASRRFAAHLADARNRLRSLKNQG